MRNTHLLTGCYTKLRGSDGYQRIRVSAIIQGDG
jgi:hypothetical protein